MSIVSSTIAIFLSIMTVFSGWWNNVIENRLVVADNAAAVELSAGGVGGSQTDLGIYPSLFNIISNSLEKLKSEIASTSTIETTSKKTTATTTYKNDLAEAIVNIQCVEQGNGYKKTVSGTGFFINQRGVILTNAHVGQFMLLEKVQGKGHNNCQIKTGASSVATYEVDLLYISPSWLLAHADLITETAPKGTGENDFALLYVTSTLDGSPLPENFPFLPPATSALTYKYYDSTVILAGYPLNGTPEKKRITATTTITNFYTFKTGLADIMSLADSPLGHEGASGGPVIDYLGRAIGVITTKEANSTALNAITVPYIDRVIETETGYDLTSTIQGDLARKAKLFNETVAPILQELLENNLR